MTQPPPPSTPPGWYVDPGDPTMLRWWDGRQWTDNWQLVPQPKKRSGATTPLLIIGGLLIGVFLFIGGCVALVAGSTTSNSDSERTTAARERPTTSTDSRAAELERQRRDKEVEKLTNKASYRAVSSRDWQLVAKNPDTHVGELYVIYGRVVQADAATGSTQMRVSTDGQQVDSYDFDVNTVVTAGLASFSEVVEDDLIAMWVSVDGSVTYDTTMGGSVTAPKVEANIIEVYGNAG
ncbi:DUF2510 domain-containing protein [Gordonia alkanivorans]|uniref:DUF2510 domain-containing protein n=1 Tax=Gordonia alkanivorans TaxID=84096 RepID=UPI0005A8123B|nr:DUF2510 domain-containing protein [Gordonia alkanivorans]